MTAKIVIEQIRALPEEERIRVIEYVHQIEESDIPESFKQGMADIESGRTTDMDTALSQPPPKRP